MMRSVTVSRPLSGAFKASRGLVLTASALALVMSGGCSSLGDRVSGLWPFGGKPGDDVKADSGRISVLALEQKLEADATLAAVPVTLPAAQALASWPSAGGVPTNAPQHIEGAASPNIVWRRQVGQGAGRRGALVSTPIVADGRIYVYDAASVVHAVDQSTGRPVWRQAMSGSAAGARRGGLFRGLERANATAGGIAFDGGKIFAGTGFGNLVALDAATGTEAWRIDTGAPIHSAPLAASGKVYVTNNDSELFAVNQANGTVDWTQSAIAEPARMLSSPSPALVGETLVAPFASGEIIAMVAANGRRLWSEGLTRAGTLTSLSAINDIAGRPAVASGTVFAASQSGILAAVDLRTGVRLWDRQFGSIQTPWVAGDFVFAVSTQGELVALDRKTGGVKWVRQLTQYENERKKKKLVSWTGPVLMGGNLILASSTGQIVLVDPADGAIKATRDAKSPIFIPPAVAGGTVYFYTNEAELIALR
jgi:outer membrane protein assembly factor BamB